MAIIVSNPPGAPLNSPAFTGTPTAPTAGVGTNTTQLSTTAFVKTAVDNAIAGVNPAVAVQAATTAAANTSGFTYSNGVSGVGATFTGSVNTAVTIDGFTFTAIGQRLLVKNDTQSPAGAFNGVYSMTVVQTVALAPVFTRALDYNSPSDINNTGAVPVVNGTVNALTSWLLTSSVTTVGTDALTYSQFSINPSTIAGTGGTTASGSVTLTAASVGAQAITTTDYGQSVTLPAATTMTKAANNYNIRNAGGYPLKVLDNAGNILGFIYPGDSSMVGCADISTAAGVWTLTGVEGIAVTAVLWSATILSLTGIKRVVLDSDRTLITFGSAGNDLKAVIYRESTNTFGTIATVRSTAGNHIAIKTATDQAMVCSCNTTTGFEAVVLSISGTTITVNTAATAVLGGNITANGFLSFIQVGTAFVVAYNRATNVNGIRSLSISGTTVTVSNEVGLDGTANTYVYLATVTSTTMLAVSLIASTSLRTMVYTISGASDPVAGTGTTTNTANATTFIIRPISAGVRWVVVYRSNTASDIDGSVISVAGTVSTVSTVNTLIATTQEPTTNCDMLVVGSKAIFLNSSITKANILTDSAGTASKGTAITVMNGSNAIGISATASVARFVCATTSSVLLEVFDCSGASLTVTSVTAMSAGTLGFPALGTTSFDGTRYPAIFVGSQTLCVGAQGSEIASRIPRIIGNALDAPPTKMPRFDDLTTVNVLSAPGRSNETWGYTTNTGSGGGGRLSRTESVT